MLSQKFVQLIANYENTHPKLVDEHDEMLKHLELDMIKVLKNLYEILLKSYGRVGEHKQVTEELNQCFSMILDRILTPGKKTNITYNQIPSSLRGHLEDYKLQQEFNINMEHLNSLYFQHYKQILSGSSISLSNSLFNSTETSHQIEENTMIDLSTPYL